jgi:hypothetical protein
MKTRIIWNVWVMLAMPAVWLCWCVRAFILYFTRQRVLCTTPPQGCCTLSRLYYELCLAFCIVSRTETGPNFSKNAWSSSCNIRTAPARVMLFRSANWDIQTIR